MQQEKRDFDHAASTWDEKPQRGKLAQDIFRSIAAAVEIRNGMKALDFGCGTAGSRPGWRGLMDDAPSVDAGG
ncbi:MAG TPA: hypothetical protein PLM53_19825 [Spirochaetota bacterium]|nr:hypothetical protein [Spirochaetota bacterium]HPC43274.1 hypothetical protein [Spirochaetota bacterium]HPL17979.1 hypothetical protein [Spirochaetota bacterium]HQF10445.1 hypothetical protein [Spirochaetota bacterium]HQH99344.1 hypothetical protein [Spirochaetota bacterium]